MPSLPCMCTILVSPGALQVQAGQWDQDVRAT